MIDTTLQSLDEKIKELKEDLWESDCSNKKIVFDLLEAMDNKMTYITKNPDRAKAHYADKEEKIKAGQQRAAELIWLLFSTLLLFCSSSLS